MYILSHALNERQDTNLINMDISRNLVLLLYIFIVLIFLQLKVSYRLHRSLSFPNFPTWVFNMLISLIYINNSNTNFCDACFFSARRHLFFFADFWWEQKHYQTFFYCYCKCAVHYKTNYLTNLCQISFTLLNKEEQMQEVSSRNTWHPQLLLI